MKVYQIIAETKHLNEAGPAIVPGAIIGGLTWAGVLGAVSLFLTTISIIDLYRILEKNNYQFESMSSEDWKDLYINLIMLAVPGAGRFGKAAIRKLIPDSWLTNAAKRAKTQITAKINKSKIPMNSPQRAARLKKLADARFAKLSTKVKNFFTTAGLASIVITYYIKLEDLESQYEAAKAGDITTEIFGDSPQEELLNLADGQRKKMLGEAVASIGAVLGALTGAKATSAMSKFFGSVKGGTIVGGLLAIPLVGVERLLKIGAASWPILLQTDAGKAFLSNNAVQLFTTITGTATAILIDSLLAGIDEIGKRVGVDTTGVTGAMKSTIAKDKEAAASAAAAAAATPGGVALSKIPYKFRIEKDSQNPKILYIGGVQVTDKDGFQNIGYNYKQDLSRSAKASGVPDPTIGLKQKPGVNYNY
jgi:hypothetical protein